MGRRPGLATGARLRDERWFSVKVELIQGRGDRFSRPPGRIFAAAAEHSFAALAIAIDQAFARWDTAHLHEFQLRDGTRIGMIDEDDAGDVDLVDERRLKLSRLKPGEQFVYLFDLADEWTHRCTVGKALIEPLATLGGVPNAPRAYFGWGVIPDQYGRTAVEVADF